jgi:undecaprenyl phosphate N,N'-diacetylbacillosamine 1-phosphate transferase
MVKTVFDKVLSVFLIILLSPVFLVIICLEFIIMGKPIFFSQKRPGLHGHVFDIYKFRTMLDLRDENGAFLPDDQRITPFCKFLRDFSIDELPQLFNVAKGNMSFVGPRPLLIEYLEIYNEEQKIRHDVKPGITGWAQINGRDDISWKQKFEYDVWYVKNQSFYLDMKIIWKTIIKVIKRSDVTSSTSATIEDFNGKN